MEPIVRLGVNPATSVIATPAIDSAAIRFPQRLVGVILGMSLAVVFTAIFLPELERIQEFELWIFGGSGSAVGPSSRGSPFARRSPKFRFASDLATRESDRYRPHHFILGHRRFNEKDNSWVYLTYDQ